MRLPLIIVAALLTACACHESSSAQVSSPAPSTTPDQGPAPAAPPPPATDDTKPADTPTPTANALPADAAAAQCKPCTDGACPAPLACVEYYGIAGRNGPTFTSCEVRCSDGATCPDGQSCTTIADGPGQVCR